MADTEKDGTAFLPSPSLTAWVAKVYEYLGTAVKPGQREKRFPFQVDPAGTAFLRVAVHSTIRVCRTCERSRITVAAYASYDTRNLFYLCKQCDDRVRETTIAARP